MSVFKKEGMPDIEVKNDGSWWQEGKRIENPPTAEELAANGWSEHTTNSEPNMAIKLADTFMPYRAEMAKAVKNDWAQAGLDSPNWQTAGNLVGSMSGLGMDITAALSSPVRAIGTMGAPLAKKGFAAFLGSKPVQTAKEIAGKMNPSFSVPPVDRTLRFIRTFTKAASPQPGSLPLDKSLATIGFKNFLQNTGDAAIFNNVERLAKGEDVQFGPAELAGGLLGGAVGTAGEKKVANDITKARYAAAKNAESVNFAERSTGKKGMQAVEQVIDENVAKHGTFDRAVANIRKDIDGLNTQMIDFMDASGAKQIPLSSEVLLDRIDNYVLEKTRGLGNKYSREYAATANEAFTESLKEIWVDRMLPLGQGNRKTLSAMAADMTPEQVLKEIPNLTLRELNWIKTSMQDRSSHWQRSIGSMAREGKESLANEKASSAINSMLDGLSNMTDDAIGELADKNIKILLPSEAGKFREINKARSNAIGNLKIMDHADRAQAKRDDIISGMTNTITNMNARARTWTSPFTRYLGTKGEQYLENRE